MISGHSLPPDFGWHPSPDWLFASINNGLVGCVLCSTKYFLMQVGFAILGSISGSVGLRGMFAPEGDNKDTVKVHHLQLAMQQSS